MNDPDLTSLDGFLRKVFQMFRFQRSQKETVSPITEDMVFSSTEIEPERIN